MLYLKPPKGKIYTACPPGPLLKLTAPARKPRIKRLTSGRHRKDTQRKPICTYIIFGPKGKPNPFSTFEDSSSSRGSEPPSFLQTSHLKREYPQSQVVRWDFLRNQNKASTHFGSSGRPSGGPPLCPLAGPEPARRASQGAKVQSRRAGTTWEQGSHPGLSLE